MIDFCEIRLNIYLELQFIELMLTAHISTCLTNSTYHVYFTNSYFLFYVTSVKITTQRNNTKLPIPHFAYFKVFVCGHKFNCNIQNFCENLISDPNIL